MLLIYAIDENAPRLNYILDEILHQRFGLDYKITTSEEYFENSQSPKINYSTQLFHRCINIPASNLLFEYEINKFNIYVSENAVWQKLFFEEKLNEGNHIEVPKQHLAFDILAASFYLISRYEEYLPTQKDKHGRYKHENSVAFKNNFLELPLVDIWMNELNTVLLNEYPNLKIKNSEFEICNSFDLDFPYKYLGLGFYRNFKKAIGNILRFDFEELKLQISVISRKTKDPFDTYDLVIEESKKTKAKTIFFFLLSQKETQLDKNQNTNSIAFVELIKTLSQNFESGLHPSYYSSINEKIWIEEKRTYEKITEKKLNISRNHFLKIDFPTSFQQLVKHTISEDYSLAYSNAIGFRASTSFPFRFFDLQKNEATNLIINPCCLMDVTLKDAMQLSPEMAIKKVIELKEKVKNVSGNFISIWHNSSLSENKEWLGWRKVWKEILN